MSETGSLDDLSSKELHDRAVKHARRHLNVGFFLKLIRTTPIARAGTGEFEEAVDDVLKPALAVSEAVDADPALMDAMRPLYLEYLRDHPDA